MTRRLKIFSVIAAGILVALYIFTYFFLTPFVKNKITSSIHNSSKGLYTLEMGDFYLEFWNSSIHIKKIVLRQDTAVLTELRKTDPTSNLSHVKMEIEELEISSFNWQNYIFNRSIEVSTLSITDPYFSLDGHVPSDTIEVGKESFLEVLPGLIASFAGSLKIKRLIIDNGKFNYNLTSDAGVTQQKGDSIFVDLKKIRIDTVPKINVLYASAAHFSLKNYTFITADSLYKLDIKQFKGSYSDSLLSINSISFTPLKKDPKGSDINITLKSVRASGINFPLFFKEKKVWLRKIEIAEPNIKAAYDLTSGSTTSSSDTSSSKNTLQIVLPYVGNSFKINEVVLTNGKINSHIKNNKGFIDQKLEKLNIQFREVYISGTTIETGRYWKNIAIKFSNFESKFQSLNLLLKINSLDGSTEEDAVKLEDVFIGQLEPSERGAVLTIENKIKTIKMEHIDFHYLLSKGGLSMKNMYADGVTLSVDQYSDLHNSSSEGGKMPNELLQTIPVYLRVDDLIVQNASIIYKDYSSKVKEQGRLTFDETSLHVVNFTNDKKLMTASHPAQLWLKTKIMGQGELKLNIKMPLLSKGFDCSFTGSLGPMNATYFNSMMQYDGMMLDDGKIEAQDFHIKVKNGLATGTMLLMYHNLNAKVIKKKTGKEKKLATLVANIVLKDKNKRYNKPSPKIITVKYGQKSDDDFLSFTWGSLSDAIVKSVVKDFFEPFVPKK